MTLAAKELNELFDGGIQAVDDFEKLMADGKINFGDLGTLIEISRHLSIYNAAVQGLNNLSLASLSQMTSDEIQSLAAKGMLLLSKLGIMGKAISEMLSKLRK